MQYAALRCMRDSEKHAFEFSEYWKVRGEELHVLLSSSQLFKEVLTRIGVKLRSNLIIVSLMAEINRSPRSVFSMSKVIGVPHMISDFTLCRQDIHKIK